MKTHGDTSHAFTKKKHLKTFKLLTIIVLIALAGYFGVAAEMDLLGKKYRTNINWDWDT